MKKKAIAATIVAAGLASCTPSTTTNADAVYAQSGKYYVMHPAAISSVGGVVEYDLSAWEGIEL